MSIVISVLVKTYFWTLVVLNFEEPRNDDLQMMDNMTSRGDPGRPPQALSPSLRSAGQEAYLGLDSANGNAGSGQPRSPSRSEELDYDYQMNNISLLKAQLKLVTHERDMLKKDVKKISMERDGALKHLSLTTGIRSS